MSVAGTTAVNCAALTNVVVSATPFHCTTEVVTKLLPVTVSVNAAPWAVAEVVERVPNVGVGFPALRVNVIVVEIPPPGVGLNTVTEAVPADCKSVAGTVAVNCVALTKVVVSATPFHCTTEALTKLVPFNVSVNAGPSAVAEVGDRNPNVGVGFAALMVNVTAVEVPPPGVGLNTVTEAVPAVEMSETRTDAVSCEALTKLVVRAVPFHCTTEPFTKLLPFTVRVNAKSPTVADVGDSEVSAGKGLVAKITSVNTGDVLLEKPASPL